MPFEPAAELPVGAELLLGERAGGPEQAIDERRGVALGEDEPVVQGALRLVEVVPEVAREQDSGQVGGGHGRRRVAGARLGARPHRVNAQLLTELPPEVWSLHRGVT